MSIFSWTAIKAGIHPIIVLEITILSLTDCFLWPTLRASIVLGTNLEHGVVLAVTNPSPAPAPAAFPPGLVMLPCSFSNFLEVAFCLPSGDLSYTVLVCQESPRFKPGAWLSQFTLWSPIAPYGAGPVAPWCRTQSPLHLRLPGWHVSQAAGEMLASDFLSLSFVSFR